MTKQTRWNSLDVIRVGSFFLIFLYHYLIELEEAGFLRLSHVGFAYENDNLNMAKIGVTLFFMISGFGLMKSSMKGFSLKEYAIKRVTRILIPYYVVSLMVLLGKMILEHGNAFAGEIISFWRILFTFIGLDGYVKEYGVATFHLGVGEWFIGCLILMYLVFPLIHRVMEKRPELTIGIATILYILIVVCYQGIVPSYYYFPIKFYDFVLGMYFARRLWEPSKKWCIICSVPAMVLMMLPWNIPVSHDFLNVLFCALIFGSVFHAEAFDPIKKVMGCGLIRQGAKYSYEVFLIHHWGIIVLHQILQPTTLLTAGVCLIVEIAVILVVGICLSRLLSGIRQVSCRIFS